MLMANPQLQVEALSKEFESSRGMFGRRRRSYVYAVQDINFFINKGEVFGLVGESGCGKSTLGKTVVRLYQPTSGHVLFEGKDIATLSESSLVPLRKKMQLVFQDPNASLNPRRTIGSSVGDALIVHSLARGRRAREQRVRTLLEQVEIPATYAHKHPSVLSGGQRQRVAIARALAVEPSFVVLDEPTSALDVSVQAKIVQLIKRLQTDFGLTYLFITHDLALMRLLSRRTAVMYLGRFYEIAKTDQLFESPLHPYTQALLASIPVVSTEEEALRPNDESREGEVPDPAHPPIGCAFHPRCSLADDRCCNEMPSLIQVHPDHFVRCHRYVP